MTRRNINENQETFPVGDHHSILLCLPSDSSKEPRQGAHGRLGCKNQVRDPRDTGPQSPLRSFGLDRKPIARPATTWERESGDSEGGYNCNLELVGQFRGEGAFRGRTGVTIDHCAYMLTDNNPLQEHRGVVVIDASDPRHPRATAYLDDPAMLDPHETLKSNVRRKLLAGAPKQWRRGLSFMTCPRTCRPPRS